MIRSILPLLGVVVSVAAASPASAATLRVSGSGSDANPCTVASPCASFDRAYRVAACADEVEVTGSLPTQTITATSKVGCTSNIVFKPVAGQTVVVQNINVENGSYMTFKNMNVVGAVRATEDNTTTPVREIVFENITAQTFKAYGNVDGYKILGGDYGNTVDWDPQFNTATGQASSIRPRNILVDGVYLHDFRASSSSSHTECFHILRADHVILRNSRLERCQSTGAIGITDGPSSDILIENNWIGQATYGGQITRNVTDLVIRNNSSATETFFFSDTGNFGPYTITGNYMPFDSGICGGATVSHNVWQGGTCNSTDRNVSSLKFKDAANFDLHLAAGSEAIDYVPSGYAAKDIDGDSRPQGSAGDAGADEVVSATPTPTPTPTPTSEPTPTPTPSPTPTPTPSPTPSPTPTPTPEPTPEPYEPACAPTCDEQIATLNDLLDRIAAILAER